MDVDVIEVIVALEEAFPQRSEGEVGVREEEESNLRPGVFEAKAIELGGA